MTLTEWLVCSATNSDCVRFSRRARAEVISGSLIVMCGTAQSFGWPETTLVVYVNADSNTP